MRFSLHPHPDTPTDAVSAIDAQVTAFSNRRFALSYEVKGNLRHVRWPVGDFSRRADELWRHSCFEAFVRADEAQTYYEFNLATSRRWAAYRFVSYRAGMEPEPAASDPRIDVRNPEPGRVLQLSATLDLGQLPALPDWQPLLFNLSAVIEERNGTKSYWALAHAGGPPDFHHPDCFVGRLP